MKKILFFILLFFILVSCGNEPSNISFPRYNVLIYQAGALNIPTDSIYLSFYFILSDDDGFEDIDKLKITHVKTEYSWEINRDQLSTYIWDNQTYYGIPFIEYNNGKAILLGDYKVEVLDKAQNITETFVNVEVEGDNSDNIYPVPEIKYTVEHDAKNKEIKIKNDKYYSVEVLFLNRADLFNGGRKKFKEEDEKIIFPELNDTKNIITSVKVNKDVNENIIYYLKNFNF
jgi:hypothetical protein